MPQLSPFTSPELAKLLEQINTPGQRLPQMAEIKLSLLLNTDPEFKIALIAIIQRYLLGQTRTATQSL
ncbi:hypothetical protein [Deinococcus ruber]|uniref:hypothetical protein n=1 Tax=Deinococcus ruber TaxID=1848197 RepID=UPI001666AF2C|nr:hypothetical protein [Deinococcus ruber]